MFYGLLGPSELHYIWLYKEVHVRMLALISGVLSRLQSEKDGQTMVEYALILFLVSIVSIVILTTLGSGIINVFTTVTNSL